MSLDSCCICTEKLHCQGGIVAEDHAPVSRCCDTAHRVHRVCIFKEFLNQLDDQSALNKWGREGQSPFYCPLCEKDITVQDASFASGVDMHSQLDVAYRLFLNQRQFSTDVAQMKNLLEWASALDLVDIALQVGNLKGEKWVDALATKARLEERGRENFLAWKSFLHEENIRDLSDLRAVLKRINSYRTLQMLIRCIIR